MKKLLIALAFLLMAAQAQAQQNEAARQHLRLSMCRFYKHFALDMALLRDQGKDETQVIARSDRIADESDVLRSQKAFLTEWIHTIFRRVDWQEKSPQAIGALIYAICMTGTE